MTTTTLCNLSQSVDVPCINRVGVARPWAWLRSGITDFARTWPASFSYGLVFAYLLGSSSWAQPALAMPSSTGFLLVGAFLAIGFYDLSQREDRARMGLERLPLISTVKRNLASIGLFGVFLAFILIVWERVSAILFGLYLGSSDVPEARVGS